MCETPSWRLEPSPYPPPPQSHPTSTYSCGVTITPRVCSGFMSLDIIFLVPV